MCARLANGTRGACYILFVIDARISTRLAVFRPFHSCGLAVVACPTGNRTERSFRTVVPNGAGFAVIRINGSDGSPVLASRTRGLVGLDRVALAVVPWLTWVVRIRESPRQCVISTLTIGAGCSRYLPH